MLKERLPHGTLVVSPDAGRVRMATAYAETVAGAVKTLRSTGARPEIVVAATHGVLVGGARERLERAGMAEVYVTDTVAVNRSGWRNLRVVSVAPLIASAIGRFIADGSLGDLF